MVDLAALRAELAAALQGVTATLPGGEQVLLTGHTQQPHPVMAWDAWPVWLTVRPVAMCIAETDWQVCVALPGTDPQSTTAAGDALLGPVADALTGYQLTTVTPGQIVIADAGPVPILIYTITI